MRDKFGVRKCFYVAAQDEEVLDRVEKLSLERRMAGMRSSFSLELVRLVMLGLEDPRSGETRGGKDGG